MKYCEVAIGREDCWTDCSPANKEKEAKKGGEHKGTNRHHHVTNDPSVLW